MVFNVGGEERTSEERSGGVRKTVGREERGEVFFHEHLGGTNDRSAFFRKQEQLSTGDTPTRSIENDNMPTGGKKASEAKV